MIDGQYLTPLTARPPRSLALFTSWKPEEASFFPGLIFTSWGFTFPRQPLSCGSPKMGQNQLYQITDSSEVAFSFQIFQASFEVLWSSWEQLGNLLSPGWQSYGASSYTSFLSGLILTSHSHCSFSTSWKPEEASFFLVEGITSWRDSFPRLSLSCWRNH